MMQKRDVEDVTARTARMLEYDGSDEEDYDDEDHEYEDDDEDDDENDDENDDEDDDEDDDENDDEDEDEDEEESVAAEKTKCCACSKRVVWRRVCAAAYGETVEAIIVPAIKPIGGRAGVKLRERLGDLDGDHVFVRGDGLCELCASLASSAVRDWDDMLEEHFEEDERRLAIFAKYVEKQCDGKLPRQKDSVPTLPGWDDPDSVAVDAPVGMWWYKVTRENDGARLHRMRETGDEATLKTLAYLDTCEPREDERGSAPVVEEDMRRLAIFAKYVEKQCDGKLPRAKDSVPTLPGWDDPDSVAVAVPIGTWWWDVTRDNDGARLRRMRETGDEATIKTLEYLDTCEPREEIKRGRAPEVEEDSRRLAIFETYVKEQCNGKLPRKGDSVPTLHGWNDPDSVAVDAPIGQWWYHVARENDGARLRRMHETGDEATIKTLEYLDTCEPRPRRR